MSSNHRGIIYYFGPYTYTGPCMIDWKHTCDISISLIKNYILPIGSSVWAPCLVAELECAGEEDTPGVHLLPPGWCGVLNQDLWAKGHRSRLSSIKTNTRYHMYWHTGVCGIHFLLQGIPNAHSTLIWTISLHSSRVQKCVSSRLFAMRPSKSTHLGSGGTCNSLTTPPGPSGRVSHLALMSCGSTTW